MKNVLFLLFLTPVICFAQTHPYQDLSYDSKVFRQPRYYRLYLPEGYHQSDKRYPVIYFFHGNTGRYNKEPNVKPEYDMLGDLVNKYQVILVMWDGNYEESNPAPYNVGGRSNVKYQVQVKDYFLEFTGHMDSNYRTLANRDYRGIIGFSMGGFASMYLAGKYPDRVSAIVDMVGSPEFFVGYPDNQTLYPLRYMFENLKDVSVRMHSMDQCGLFFLNYEIKNGAEWEGMPHFEYWQGFGGHKVDDPGETKIFEMAMQFIINRFHRPIPLQKAWSHYDLYPEFDVWGYTVESNKAEPGFLYLRNVSPAGFGFYTRRWAPDGPPIENCTATVTTAPLYKRGESYELAVYRQGSEKPVLLKKKADGDGRIQIELTGDGCEVSISHASQPADFIVFGHQLAGGKRYVRVNGKNELYITFLHRGGDAYEGNVQLTVNCTEPTVSLSNAVQDIVLDTKGSTFQCRPIGVTCTKTPPPDGSPPWIKLNVQVRCGHEVSYDVITLPVFFDVPYFANITIDDGRLGSDSAQQIFGTGNGNGLAEASEQIMAYENGHRLRLYTDDPYIEPDSELLFDEIVPGGIWGDGVTLSSIVKIAANCPPGHTIEFLAKYETKIRPIHRLTHWGKVKITVK